MANQPTIVAVGNPPGQPFTLTFGEGLFTARAIGPKGKEQGKAKFSANFETDPSNPDRQRLIDAAVAVAKARWPGRDLKELHFPFLDGTKEADKAKAKGKDREFSRGKFIVVSRSQYEPTLSYVEGGRLVEELEGERRTAAKGKFYNGSDVLAEFNLVPYDGVGANPDGVTAYLNKVCSLARGTKLRGSSTSSAETFKGYIGTTSDFDPTEGSNLDAEIAF